MELREQFIWQVRVDRSTVGVCGGDEVVWAASVVRYRIILFCFGGFADQTYLR